jgi:iron-sulfur cluster assembly accessory protein
MNHFELFNLPVALDIDLAALKNEFLKLQQQYHPDKAEDKDQALIKSSEINQAFKALSNVDSRAAYLLSLKKQDYHLQMFEQFGVKVFVDPKSLVYLEGMEMDYVKNGLNEGFEFNNPNKKGECGCGESFTV